MLMPQAMKIPATKAAMDKECQKLEKIPAWNLTKVRSEKEVIDEARTSGATIHFALLMDICHLNNAELEAKHQKYKGRVVVRSVIVTDNSGACAYLQNKDHHKWQKQKRDGYHFQTAGLRGTRGKRSIWSYPGEKLKDAPKLCKIPRSECPDIRICLPRQKWPKSMRGKFRRSYWNMEGRKFPIGNVSLFILKRIILIFVCGWHVDDIKLAGK